MLAMTKTVHHDANLLFLNLLVACQRMSLHDLCCLLERYCIAGNILCQHSNGVLEQTLPAFEFLLCVQQIRTTVSRFSKAESHQLGYVK